MFDMFDSSNRGWLAKLIEEEVEVVAAIVESELVGIVWSSDTMKRIELRSRLKQTKNSESQEKNREWKKSEKQREKKRESSRIFCKCLLTDLHYNYLYLYTELTITT